MAVGMGCTRASCLAFRWPVRYPAVSHAHLIRDSRERTPPLSHACSSNTAPPPSDATPIPRAAPHASTAARLRAALPAAYVWYLAGTGSWFFAVGMQGVLFAWLVVGVLQADAEWVGISQSAMLLPSVLLLLPAGALADRYDQRQMLVVLHLIAAAVSAGLFVAAANDWLSMPLLLAYAVGMGTVQAFVMPARDAQLSYVAGTNMLRSVAGMTITQWGMQILGSLLAGTARWIGTIPALGLHCLALLVGIAPLQKIPSPKRHAARGSLHLNDVLDGAREVAHSPALLATLLLAVAVGVFFIGPFLVVLPLLVRDFYDGGVDQLALLNMTFPLGTIVGSLGVLGLGGIRHKGKAQLAALLAGSGCVYLLSLGLPFWGTLLSVCAWGVSAAVFINAGRTVYQEQASTVNRARVLSVYTIGFMGAAGLLGAPLSGVLVDAVGPLTTCTIAGGSMVVVVGAVFLCTAITQVE